MDVYQIIGLIILWIVAGFVGAMANHIFGIFRDN